MRRAPNAWDRFYHHHSAPWRGTRPIDDLLPLMGSGPVLELGAGNGKLWRPLRDAGVDAVAVDISWNALRSLPRGPRVLADAACLPFADASFTTVLDIHCTGHLDPAGRQAAAAEATRVLAPGGVLVVERLGRDDLRAHQGAPVPDDPDARVVADGRTTHFSDGAALAASYALDVVSVDEARRTPRLRGVPTVRQSWRVVLRKPTG